MAVDFKSLFWPLSLNKIRRGKINNTFGMVRKTATGQMRPHQGWDFEARIGTPFFAIAAGKVEFVVQRGDYGLQLCHSFSYAGQTLYAFYAHLSQVYVKTGDVIASNQLLGVTGDTGNAKSQALQDQHLHFEIRETAHPRLGLQDRIDPIQAFGFCPLNIGVAG
ncbi:M23 family metallopeptidase [Limnobacter humi]|uniref:M23 family metallopeptidase n=1 Tax=Limnobacter humi TaxID=1778671 RepID=A0ABT1WGA2_9BURK|nr:M23 family metallopeptidase [Limnobacter humi]MCQ8896414.1 M23 family metallopeptidase [Limnobacter humi]